MLNENITSEDLTTPISVEENVNVVETNQKSVTLKYTCLECDYKTKVKSHMDKHVQTVHIPEIKELNFICGICKHEFVEKDNYNTHVKIHDGHQQVPTYTKDVPIEEPHDESDKQEEPIIIDDNEVIWLIQRNFYHKQPR